MAFFGWNDNLSVGVQACDDDHKKLIDMLNRLYEGMRSGQGKEVVGKVLDGLISYTKFHFAREEELFAKAGYPAIEHKEQHRLLVKQAEDLQSRYKSGENSISIEALDFLKDWLTIHIQGSDKKYTDHLNAAGIR
ncbi:MAG: bacteriohemerythrin [Terracidiphilus sp.]|jgi:hemerythrin